MATSTDHSSARPPTGSANPDYDAIIIGSGIGGLTTAGLLAGVGREQHYA